MIILGIQMGRSIQSVVFTTLVKDLAHELPR